MPAALVPTVRSAPAAMLPADRIRDPNAEARPAARSRAEPAVPAADCVRDPNAEARPAARSRAEPAAPAADCVRDPNAEARPAARLKADVAVLRNRAMRPCVWPIARSLVRMPATNPPLDSPSTTPTR